MRLLTAMLLSTFAIAAFAPQWMASNANAASPISPRYAAEGEIGDSASGEGGEVSPHRGSGRSSLMS